MRKDTRRSGVSLVLAGLAGIGFFWLTDPSLGMFGESNAANAVDVVNHAATGTYVGIVGGVAIVTVGVWLMLRRGA
jgi:hypothetical protein